MRRPSPAVLAAALALAVLAAPASAVGDEAGARIALTVEPRRATVGDPLAATLEVVVPDGVELPAEPLPERLGPFEVLDGAWSGPATGADGERRWTWSGRLAAYETGELELPAIELALRPGTLRSEPLTVTIDSVLDDAADAGPEAELAGLRGQLALEPDYGPLRTAGALLLAALALLALVWWARRRLAGRLAAVEVPDDPFRRLPPHVWALERLAEVLKRYLGGRYRVELLERTTAEVPGAMALAGAPESAIAGARELLERFDAVKFAGDDPPVETLASLVEAAIALVERTRPAESSRLDADAGADERGAA